MRRPLIWGVLLIATVWAEAAFARCSSPAEVIHFEGSIRAALRCAERGLFRILSRPCVADAPPACGAAEYAAVLDLVYGAAPPGVADPRTAAGRCQSAISRASVSYLRNRLPGRLFGRRRAPLKQFLRKVEGSCAGVSVLPLSGGRLPAVAEGCASLSGSGEIASGVLARCLSARLEALVDATVPVPMRPNVVLVLTDDQRLDSLDVMPTVLSEIAGRGVRFGRAFTTTSVCAPSRASILTGLYAHNHGIVDNGSLLIGGHAFDHENHVAGWLRSAGYRTALFGKYLNNVYAMGETKPNAWDEWRVFTFDMDNYRGYPQNVNGHFEQASQAEAEYSTDRMARETMRFMGEHAEEPFFVMYAPYAPHGPYAPAQRHIGTFAGLPPARPPNFWPADVSLKPNWVRFMKLATQGDSPAPLDQTRRDYLETLLAVDEAVGDISEDLDRLGLTDNTMVIFLSDNGHHFGEQWWDGKFTSYEEAIRIPFLLRYPVRYPLAQERNEIVLNVDVATTIADATGVTGAPMNGQSILALLDGSAPPREDAMHENFSSFIFTPSQGLRTDEWKYIHSDATQGVTEELYDLVADPYELVNLAFDPDFQAIKQELAALLAVRQSE
jgi:N-acetylglucosamine-6-sulfatase